MSDQIAITSQKIKEEATRLGFSACGIARVEPVEEEMKRLDTWLAKGYQAGMAYLANHREIRRDPQGLVEGARSIISVALNYYPACKRDPDQPHIAYYAYGQDYHVVVKEKLRQLWQYVVRNLPEETAEEARVFTDSAPLLERYWAWKAGLGWIGKNTQLILPGKGSFFFLGEIVTTWEADAYDEPVPSRCGNCDRCLRACPTGALEKAFTLNANHCLSYLTIENREDIPPREAQLLGDRLYGGDTCPLVCPWNRFAQPTQEAAFQPSEALLRLQKEDLKMFTKDDYSRIFAKSAVKRAKYEGLLRTIKHLKLE